MNAIITGATKGIGRSIVQILAKNGVDLFLCSRNESNLMNLKNELSQEFPDIKVASLATDMSQKTDILEFSRFIKSETTSIDIIINNAGIFIPGSVFEEADDALEKMMETNLYSAYHLTRQFLPMMVAQKKGHIINMCSIASKAAYPNGGSYSISKFALLGFNKVLREELKPHNIRVTAVLPGATWSDSWKGVDLPFERLMNPEDIAKAVWNAIEMSDTCVVEEIILRPQLGDL